MPLARSEHGAAAPTMTPDPGIWREIVAQWVEEPAQSGGRKRRRRRRLPRDRAAVAVTVSNDNQYVAFVACGRLRAMERTSRETVLDHEVLDGLGASVARVAFIGKSGNLLALHSDGTVILFTGVLPSRRGERTNSALVRQSILFSTPALEMDVCKAHSLAAVGGEDGCLYLFDPVRYEQTREELEVSFRMIGSVSLSEDGRYAAVCSASNSVILVRVGTLDGIPSVICRDICLSELVSWTWGCVLSSDGKHALTGTTKLNSNLMLPAGAAPTALRLWNLDLEKPEYIPIVEQDYTERISFYSVSGDLQLCIALDVNNTRLYSIEFHVGSPIPNPKIVRSLCTFDSKVISVAMGKGGIIVCATADGDLTMLDLFHSQRLGVLCFANIFPRDILMTIRSMLFTSQ